MRSTILAAAIGGIGLSFAQTHTAFPSSNTTVSTPSATGAPCAVISAYLSQATDQIVPAQLAYDCLSSVPVDVNGDQLLIQQLKLFFQWQSNTAYLKNPPRQFGYKEKAVDIMGGLDTISSGVKNGTYKSDYAVQQAIYNLLISAYDNHLGFSADILNIFQFFRPGGVLVSVSTDGIALPQVYAYNDLNKTRHGATFTPSPIKSIDGEDVITWLSEQAAGISDYHDADARFNDMFLDQASLSTGSEVLGNFYLSGQYARASTNVTFANGTAWSIQNQAIALKDFTGVNSGPALFSKFCQGPQTTASPTGAQQSTVVASSTPTVIPTPVNYPAPVVYDKISLAIGGYYLQGAGFEDVAVLSIPSFEGSLGQFQNVTRAFLADAKSKGKTKLIVDTRGNGGGLVDAGYDTFKQLFPTLVPYGAGRWRAHDAWHYFGEATTVVAENTTLLQTLNKTSPSLYHSAISEYSDYDYLQNLDINNKVFTSFNQFYGPHSVYGDNFTTVQRRNFAEAAVEDGLWVTGYGPNAIVTAQPFLASNIVILQDGHCSSTCTVFSELMRMQGHVQTIAIGGLPVAAPMQGVSGTKGSRVVMFSDIISEASDLLDIVGALDAPTAAKLNATVIGTLANPVQVIQRANVDATGKMSGSFNAIDNLRPNDTTETPLEFVYEAADCKLFYTANGIFDVTQVWKSVVTAKWGGGKCVANSTGDATSESVVYGNSSTPYTGPQSNGAVKGLGMSGFALVGVALAMFL